MPEVRCPRSEVRNRGGKQRNERKTRKMGRNQPKTEGELRMDRMARMGTGNGDFTANGREWTQMGTEEGDFQQENRNFQENRRGIARGTMSEVGGPKRSICVHLRLFLVLGAEKTARNGLGRAEWGGHLGASGLNRRRGVREAETCRAGARKSGPAFWAGPRGGRGGNS